MPDYGKRTGRDAFESVTRRLEAVERELRRGGRLSTLDRGDTAAQPAPVEGQVMIQYDSDEPWYYANGEWRDFCCGSGGVFDSYRNCTLARPGLVAFWPLDDTASPAVDIVGGRNMAETAHSGYPTWGQPGPFPDQPDTSIQFGGASGGAGGQARLEVAWAGTSPGDPFHDTFQGTHAFTIEMWIYPTVAQDAKLFEFWGGTIGDWVLVDWFAAGYVAFTRASDGLAGGAGLSDAPLNAWSHVRATYDGSLVELFVNTVPAGTDASTAAIAAPAQIAVGNDRGSPWRPFNGRVADLAVYSEAAAGFCSTVTEDGPISTGAAAGTVSTADGLGGTTWEYPVEVWVNGA